MLTQRYKLTIAYRGTHYHGWQRQLAANTWKGPTPAPGCGIPTIQETIASRLGKILGHPVEVVGSSRTDSGVHAKGQVAHFDTFKTQIPARGVLRAVNHQLPPDIILRDVEAVPDSFDAITSTVSKRYQFAVWAAEFRNPFLSDLYWHHWRPLDHHAMREAAAHFVGTHDFASFARPGHKRVNTIRTVLSCDVSRRGPIIVIGVTGTGFLWNMVRIMVGTIVEIGWRQYSPNDIPKMLAARDRRAAGSTAPPEGLYLQWVRVRTGNVSKEGSRDAVATAETTGETPDLASGEISAAGVTSVRSGKPAAATTSAVGTPPNLDADETDGDAE